MKLIHNERGAALVLVLLAVMVAGILGTVLASQILTAGTQATKSQNLNKAENLAKMGKEFFIQEISHLEEWQNQKSRFVNYLKTRTIDDDHSYSIRVLEIEESEQTVVTYESTGISGDTEEVLTGQVTISVSETWIDLINKEIPPDLEDFTEIHCETRPGPNRAKCDVDESGNVYLTGSYNITGRGNSNHEITIDGDLWVDGSIELGGNSSITINGFTYFENSRLFMNGSPYLLVNGDAYFDFSDVDFRGGDQTVIVTGNAYFVPSENQNLWLDAFCVVGQSNIQSLGEQECRLEGNGR
ncbi:hypothetical protein EQV77_01105 [Halobacillus fulvus]|nr:hypothetical protein EQV77_01105 [Halobacillus fulvus]